jgi:branched-subunit amino acid aminotransferase/4-amino-4-deoxychorismate lyase
MKVWRDGVWQETEYGSLVGTPAFQFGFGLFETIRIRDGKALDLESHLLRMEGSMKVLDTKMTTINGRQIGEAASLAVERYAEPDGVLKIIAYKGADKWGILFLARPFPYRKSDYERGWSICCSPVRRNATSLVVRHKTLNYLENHLERQKAQARGFDDAYFLNGDGIVTECTIANIFVVFKKRLMTSPVKSGLLPGIMRAKVLHVAPELGFETAETAITVEALLTSDAVFVTNALMGIMPVTAIDGRTCSRDDGMAERLNKLVDR